MVPRKQKEALLEQTGLVIWLFGLSGAGKTTIAAGLEAELYRREILTQLLDGDNVRSGLNRDLGFSEVDRQENIRRVAETAKLHANAGIATIVSCITPTRNLRSQARTIIGADDYLEVFVACDLATCEKRDVKNLYAQAKSGRLTQFTGKDSRFEPPAPDCPPDLTLSTADTSPDDSIRQLLETALPRIRPSA